jgi:hypothetical protein
MLTIPFESALESGGCREVKYHAVSRMESLKKLYRNCSDILSQQMIFFARTETTKSIEKKQHFGLT